MPSIHRRFKSPFWVAAFMGPDGRRAQRSTKTRDRELALRLTIEWSKAAKAAREHRLPESQCRKVLSELHEYSTGEPLAFHTARDGCRNGLTGKRVLPLRAHFCGTNRSHAILLSTSARGLMRRLLS